MRMGLRRITGWGFACFIGMSGQAFAAQVAIVMSDDSAPYQEVYKVIQAQLAAAGHEVSPAYAEGLAAHSLNEARLIIAVGVRAADGLSSWSNRTPVLAVLVPRAWYIKAGRARLSDGGRRSVSAIYLDQPLDRQARLIRLAFPEARRVGVLLSTDQMGLADELEEALRPQRLGLMHATVAEGDRLIAPLEQVLSEANVLLAFPDPLVFNRNTAQSLFLTSYRYRDPVVGYSRSMTRAGAMVSLYSTPSQIGRQAAEWTGNALNGATVRLPAPAHPAYFEVSINDQVARSLGFSLPSEAELEKRLGEVR
ncbi:MAG: ABC transporter substrate-binding protein [Thiobacillus sp.]